LAIWIGAAMRSASRPGGGGCMRDALLELLQPEVEALGLELVELEFAAHRGGGLVRLYIDRPGSTIETGVTVEECEAVSRRVSALLDEKDPVRGAYTLEVSSPGWDRPLRLLRHFQAAVGERIRLELAVPRGGRRRYTGRLEAAGDDGRLCLSVDGAPVEIGYAEVAKARVAPE
jgi:ribosome maturation factor RimP